MENFLFCLPGTISAIVVLYCSDRIVKKQSISEKNTGQKYKYKVQFFLSNNQVVKLYFYSEYSYESITHVIQNGYIRKEGEFYSIKNQGKEVLIDRKNIISMTMQRFENI